MMGTKSFFGDPCQEGKTTGRALDRLLRDEQPLPCAAGEQFGAHERFAKNCQRLLRHLLPPQTRRQGIRFPESF